MILPGLFEAVTSYQSVCAHLMRAPQLYSRIGFAHEMEPLSDEETCDFLHKRWSHRVKAYSDDFTDKEAVAKEVVEKARQNLIIGPARSR